MIAAQTASNDDERNWGMYGHLSGILAYSGVPFGGVIGPLVLYLQNKRQRPFAAEQAWLALNFHITISALQLIAIIWAIVLYFMGIFSFASQPRGDEFSWRAFSVLGAAALCFFTYFLLYVWSFTLTIIGTVRASSGRLFAYPLTFPFVR